MGEPERRRRRLRPPSTAAADATDPAAIETAPVADVDEVAPVRPVRPRPPSGIPPVDDRDAERGLRGLVGSGSSQVSVGAALRARDAARPTDEHLAEAERSLTIVRRNWSPPS